MIGSYKIDDLRHSCRGGLRIRGQSLDSHLIETVGVTEIAEGFMGYHNILVRQGRQGIFKFLI